MHTNLPVSQHEHPFPANETLLSTTDTSSRMAVATSGLDAAANSMSDQARRLVEAAKASSV